MKTYCFALDLKDDPRLIKEYKASHDKIWPEITKSIKDSGIINLEIYNTGNRLFMIMKVDDFFSFEKKSNLDKNNPKVQEWEILMWTYQQTIPSAKKNEKWVLMDRVYKLEK